MDREQKRVYLIEYLLAEREESAEIPSDEYRQKRLLRGLLNVRMPQKTSEEFLRVQDEYLKEELALKGITDIADLTPICGDIYLWQGDITTLKCDGIVNAANSQMLGCFLPNHLCIDNAIHTFAGVQLRAECADIMKRQGSSEPTGSAKITRAYNLPCKYILHTVGPIVDGRVGEKHKKQLEDCYRSCLALAEEKGLKSLAFCCISTGAFHFPAALAAKIAVRTVQEYKKSRNTDMKIIFNVFSAPDFTLYHNLLKP